MVGSIVGMQSSEILQVASEYEVKVCVILSLTADFNLSLLCLLSLFFSFFVPLFVLFSLSPSPPSLAC